MSKRWTAKEREQAVRMVEAGRTLAEAAQAMDVRRGCQKLTETIQSASSTKQKRIERLNLSR